MEQEKTLTTLDDLVDKANTEYLQMIKDGKIKDILRAIGLFPDQTISNDILILSQKPDAICVKRMKEWNYYHRSVKKSEKSIKVVSHFIDKRNIDYIDEDKTYTKSIEKLSTCVGYLFDITQTTGQEYDYLNSNKENIAKHFEAAKSALERTAKGFEVLYRDQEENATIDFENKKLYVKDGLSIDELINTLIDNVATVLLSSRREEGLDNLSELETQAVIYAVKSKLGLDLPEYDFDVSNLSDEEIVEFKGNLHKVRSVSKQMLSNFESAIERAVRDLDKKIKEQEEKVAEEVQEEKPVKKISSRSKKAQSEVENA